MKSLVETIRVRDGLSMIEAIELVNDARNRVRMGENPEEIMYEEFGLELDYIFDLLE